VCLLWLIITFSKYFIIILTTMIFSMKNIQPLAIGVSLAVAATITNISDAANVKAISSSTIQALRSTSSRRLEDAATTTPTTCTDIPNGYEAFDVAAEEAFKSRNEEEDCHTYDGTEDGYQDPIDDVFPSVQETTRLELCISNDQSTRYIFSNGLPDHDVLSRVARPTHCLVPYAVGIPTNPFYDATYKEETPIAGPIGFTIRNGIPFVDSAWPVSSGFLQKETSWM
jgi:hypothetical protein